MSDVNIKYKGTSIATIDASGSKTLQTSGKYCEGDIVVEYTDPEKPTQAKSATPTETAQDITPDSGKVLSKVSVGAIPKTYVGSGVTKKAAATVAPSTSEQTVCASGVYTTGEQKVSAITPSIVGNLDASSFAAPIVAAIEGKGVTVPAGTLLDGMASLIESIEAGGGGAQFGDYDIVQTGTITPSSDISEYVLDTGITIASKTQAENTLFLVFLDHVYGSFTSATKSLLVGFGGRDNGIIPSFSFAPAVYFTASFSLSFETNVVVMPGNYPSSIITIACGSTMKLRGGSTYRWIMLSKGA